MINLPTIVVAIGIWFGIGAIMFAYAFGKMNSQLDQCVSLLREHHIKMPKEWVKSNKGTLATPDKK